MLEHKNTPLRLTLAAICLALLATVGCDQTASETPSGGGVQNPTSEENDPQTPPQPQISQLQLIVASTVIDVDGSTPLYLFAHFANGQSANVTSLATWHVDAPELVQVQVGLFAILYPQQLGTFTIRGEFEGFSSNSITVQVVSNTVELQSLTLSAPNELFVGQSAAIACAGNYSDGTSGDVSGSVELESDDEEVVGIVSGAIPSIEARAPGTTLIRATSDGQVSNDILVTVVPSPTIAIRMNAAGPATEVGGLTFAEDSNATSLQPGFTDGKSYSNVMAIAGTDADALYQHLRWDHPSFRAPVPVGLYRVDLHFAETYPGFGSGSRVFDVLIESNVVEEQLDVCAEAGFATALVKTYFVTVQDGQLDVEFDEHENHAILSAVEISSIGEVPEQEVTSLVLTPNATTIFEGGIRNFQLVAHFNFGPSQVVTDVAQWSSSNSQVLSLTASPGLFEGLSIGTANVTASYMGHAASAQVTVEEAPPVGEGLIFVRGNNLNLFDVIPRDRTYIENTAHADIMKLEPISPNGTVTNLTQLPAGQGAVAFTPHVTPDGQYVLFAMRQHFTDMYEIFRMRVDGNELTQLTFPPVGQPACDNIHPVVIGGDKIAFLSNREFMYDEYGKRNQYNLYTMNFDGSDVTRHLDGLSGNTELDCFSDGSIVFTRWDYRPLMNKLAVDNYSLWRMNTDGSDTRVHWGLYFLKPRPSNHGIQDWRRAHELPDGRMVTIGVGRTYTRDNYGSGFIAMVDPVTSMLQPYTNITPGVPEDTTPSNVGRYLEAVPRGADQLVVVHSSGAVVTGSEPHWKLRVMQNDGSAEFDLLSDPQYHLAQPRVIQPRPTPPFISSVEQPELQYGILACDNVYIENHAQEIGSLNRPPHDANDPQLRPVKVRLLEGKILRKTQFWDGTPSDTTFISDVKASLAYKILGEVPIAADGSFAARVPAQKPIVIQTLNARGHAIITMPFWTTVAPGETKRCIGCHDPHDNSVELAATNDSLTAPHFDATQGDIFDFQDQLSPVLASKCGSCHSGANAAGGVDLSGDRTLFRDVTYRSLSQMEYGRFGLPSWMHFSYLASKDRGIGGVDSFLLALVSGNTVYGGTSEMNSYLTSLHSSHAGLLTPHEERLLAQWTSMATLFGTPVYRYVPQGEFDNHYYPQPDMELWETEVAPMLVGRCGSCHSQYPSALQIPGFTVNTQHSDRSANVNHQSVTALLNRTGVNSNFDNPLASPILRLTRGESGHPVIFGSTNDPDYQSLLQWIASGQGAGSD